MLSRPLAALNMRLAFLGARAARDLVDLATKVPRSPWMVSRFGSQSSASVLASICSRVKRLMMSETIWKSTPRRTDLSKHVAKCSPNCTTTSTPVVLAQTLRLESGPRQEECGVVPRRCLVHQGSPCFAVCIHRYVFEVFERFHRVVRVLVTFVEPVQVTGEKAEFRDTIWVGGVPHRSRPFWMDRHADGCVAAGKRLVDQRSHNLSGQSEVKSLGMGFFWRESVK